MFGLRFALLNAQGLVTKRTNKLQTEYIKNVFERNDIIMFTETWADGFSEMNVDKFDKFILNRTVRKFGSKRNSGGIAIYVRHGLTNEDSLIFESKDVLYG